MATNHPSRQGPKPGMACLPARAASPPPQLHPSPSGSPPALQHKVAQRAHRVGAVVLLGVHRKQGQHRSILGSTLRAEGLQQVRGRGGMARSERRRT